MDDRENNPAIGIARALVALYEAAHAWQDPHKLDHALDDDQITAAYHNALGILAAQGQPTPITTYSPKRRINKQKILDGVMLILKNGSKGDWLWLRTTLLAHIPPEAFDD